MTCGMKHTPGPWRACDAKAGTCECRQVWAPGGDVMVAIASVADQTDGMGVIDRAEAMANAKLIAQAPALLEALEKTATRLENYPNRISGFRPPVEDHVTTLYEDIRQAITAATA